MNRYLLSLILILSGLDAIELGSIPKLVIIDGKNGGKIDGGAWNSSMIKNKVSILFYVDPDKRDDNVVLTKALKAEKFDRSKYQSIAIINLAATWLPDAILESKLAEKQKEFPDTIYVKDKTKFLLDRWKLQDDSSDILLFDKRGTLIYKKFGKLSSDEIKKVINLIESNI